MTLVPSQKLDELQQLRGIAALLVVADHSISQIWGRHNIYLEHFAWHLGDVGVSIFFVLSGFIMVHASRKKFGHPGEGKRFIGRRMERVVPLYWLATIVAAGFAARHSDAGQLSIRLIKSMLFIPYANDAGIIRPIHGVGWTLNYEMMFYAIFALYIFMRRDRAIAATICTLVALALVGLISEGRSWGDDAGNLSSFITYPIILLFGAGMLLARFDRHIATSTIAPLCGFTLIIAVTIIYATAIKTYPVTIIWRFIVWIACVAYVAIVLWFRSGRELKGWFQGGLVRLGDQSYSTYLFHLFAISQVTRPFIVDLIGRPAAFMLCIFVGHSAGYAGYRLIERPLMAFFKRRHRLDKPPSLPV